ncbi:hypothetical protein B0J14DRAFT_595612 [Halenospora varia]|nr:hypothetical protein B0J14DRAFT_595612 [Halenospora varia]
MHAPTLLASLLLAPLALANPITNPVFVPETSTSSLADRATTNRWNVAFLTGVNCGSSSKTPASFGDKETDGSCQNIKTSTPCLSAKATGNIGKRGGFMISVYPQKDCKESKNIFATQGEKAMTLAYNNDCVSQVIMSKDQRTWQSFRVFAIPK